MRFFIIIFLFIGSACFAQEKKDSTSIQAEPEWNTKNYTQVAKIYNRSVWTFADNPALAGFDRKLAVAYRFGMRNLSMGVPNDEGNLELAFMKHEAFADYGFGGKRKNWGVGLYYNHEKEFQHKYHRAGLSTSYRVQVQRHSVILGLGGGVQFSRLEDWDNFRFSDEYDPRYGFVYPTQEVRPSERRIVGFINVGLRYNWKRLFFGYALQSGPHGAFALYGPPTSVMHNRLRLGYHIQVEDDLTITPELVTEISTTYYNDPIAPGFLLGKTTNNYPLFSGYATFTYKDVAFGQIGIVNHNQMVVNVGYQFKDMLVLHIGTSGYFVKEMAEIGGWAGVEAGLRFQINPKKQ